MSLALTLVEACVAPRHPDLSAVCRGFPGDEQSPSAARCITRSANCPGRMNHRCREHWKTARSIPTRTVIFADRHDVKLVPGGVFAKLLSCETIRVNSLHGQGILGARRAES